MEEIKEIIENKPKKRPAKPKDKIVGIEEAEKLQKEGYVVVEIIKSDEFEPLKYKLVKK